MKDLSDLAICKRIAEIEGKKVVGENYASVSIEIFCPTLEIPAHQQYNPLTDDALNLQLRDKHCVEVAYDGYCLIFDEEHFVVIVSIEWDNVKGINKSACLAIIKLKESNND